MSFEPFYLLRTEATVSAIAELDDVVLTADVTSDDGDVIPAGAEGTVVGVWNKGEAYEVEFAIPVEALATVRAVGLRRVERGRSLNAPDWPTSFLVHPSKIVDYLLNLQHSRAPAKRGSSEPSGFRRCRPNCLPGNCCAIRDRTPSCGRRRQRRDSRS